MLNAKVSEQGIDIECNGPLSTILADISLTINQLFNIMRTHDPLLAEAYQDNLIRGVSDRSGPVWMVRDITDGSCTIIVSPNVTKGDDHD